MPRPRQVDLLTLKVVSQSRVTWATSVPFNCLGTAKFDVITRGRGACILVSAMPVIPREWSFSAPQVWRFCIYLNTLYHRTTKFGMVTQYGRGVFQVSHAIAFAQCIARFVSYKKERIKHNLANKIDTWAEISMEGCRKARVIGAGRPQ